MSPAKNVTKLLNSFRSIAGVGGLAVSIILSLAISRCPSEELMWGLKNMPCHHLCRKGSESLSDQVVELAGVRHLHHKGKKISPSTLDFNPDFFEKDHKGVEDVYPGPENSANKKNTSSVTRC